MPGPEANSKPHRVPDSSLRRLPVYYHFLQTMQAAGVANVSTTVIANALNLDPTLVRKDLETTGIVGKPKVGYSLDILIQWIERFLGWHQINDAVLVGTGSLGTALLGYKRFRELGFQVVAGFDSDPAKVGGSVAGIEIHHIDDLPEECRRHAVRLGVITTPSSVAQSVADKMIQAGIRGIWNFAPVHLRVPDSVVLQSEDLYHSLAFLSFRLERKMTAEREAATPTPAPVVSDDCVPTPEPV